MDISGYKAIKEAVRVYFEAAFVSHGPKEDESIRFVSIGIDRVAPGNILNALDEAGLLVDSREYQDDRDKPALQHFSTNNNYITFEDVSFGETL